MLSMMCLAMLCGCADSERGYKAGHLSGVIWGTAYNITYKEYPTLGDVEITEAVFEALDGVDMAANAFNAQSEVSVFNATGRLTGASDVFRHLYARSEEINRLTDGAFDPTVAPLVNLWGFGSSEGKVNPTEQDIALALASVGMDNINVTDSAFTAVKDGVQLDFAAIAKGYGVDCAATALKNMGIEDFMVEIGGEVRVSGRNPHGESWAIQIDAPSLDTTGSHTRLAIVRLTDAAVATSGNYRNFHTDDKGNLVGHTISPVTGRPVQTEILSASVFAEETVTADALATASMVMGMDAATETIKRLADNPKSGVYGAVFVTSEGERFVIHPVALNGQHVEITTR